MNILCIAKYGVHDCTLPLGHEGDHVAMAAMETARWPKAPVELVAEQLARATGEVAALRRQVEDLANDRAAADAEAAKLRQALEDVDRALDQAERDGGDAPHRAVARPQRIGVLAGDNARLRAENKHIRGNSSWAADRLKTVVANMELATGESAIQPRESR